LIKGHRDRKEKKSTEEKEKPAALDLITATTI